MKKLFTFILVTLLATTVAWADNVYVKVASEDQLVAAMSSGSEVKLVLGYKTKETSTSSEFCLFGSLNNTNSSNNGFKRVQHKQTQNQNQSANDIVLSGDMLSKVTEFTLSGESGAWTLLSSDIDNQGSSLLTMAPNKDVVSNPTAKGRLGLKDQIISKYLKFFKDGMDTWVIRTDENGCYLSNSYDNNFVIKQKGSAAFNLFDETNQNYNAHTKAYIYLLKEQPSLTTTVTELNLGKKPSGTFTVKGKALTGDVSITVKDGSTDGFRIEPSSPISAADVMSADGIEITVYYEGTTHEAEATLVIASNDATPVEVKVTAKSSAEWTTIYIPKSAGDYYIWAWDANGTTPGQTHDYFESRPGKKINELETVTLGSNGGNDFYKFEYADNATGLGLVFAEGPDGPQTANITPKDHEIYYYAGGTDCPIGIPMDEVIFPDEIFLKYIKSSHFKSRSGEKYDKPHEYNDHSQVIYILESEELASIDFMQINNQTEGDLASFKGLEYFTNLKEVELVEGNNFHVAASELDLSMSPSLEKLRVEGAFNLTSLKLPDGTLKELDLQKCNSLPVNNLNQELATFENLEKLSIKSCDLINSLNVEQNYNLTYLSLSELPIPALNLANNSKLEELYLSSTNIGGDNLNADLAMHEKLRILKLSSNKNLTATTLDLSKHTNLNTLMIIQQPSFKTFDLTNNKKLRILTMNELENLETLTIPSDLTTLEQLSINFNEKLNNHTFDLGNNKGLVEIEVNFLGQGNVIKGMSNAMTGLKYVRTEKQLYDGNVLDLHGCTLLYRLNVSDCGLERLDVSGCTELGSRIKGQDPSLTIEENHLRALDLTGVKLPYNYNKSPRGDTSSSTGYDTTSDQAYPNCQYFLPDDYPGLGERQAYLYHTSYNSQKAPTLTPNVALVYHDRWAATPNYTYLVYVRLDENEKDKDPKTGKPVPTLNELFRQEAQERLKNADIPIEEVMAQIDNVADPGFDYQRVKLWSRFATTKKGPVLDDVHGTTEIHAITGVPEVNWSETETMPDLSQVDPTHVLGKVLSLGMYTVPCGHDRRYHETSGAEGTTADIEPAYVGGTVSYLYSTLDWGKEDDDVIPDGPSKLPMRDGGTGVDLDVYDSYNGTAITSEDYYRGITVQDNAVVEKYDNAIPFEFDWQIMLTNDPESIVTAIKGIHGDLPALIEEIQYYNVMGQMSHKPFDGVNIVVTRYSDGTTTTQKVIR